jgi:hypothetical protein
MDRGPLDPKPNSLLNVFRLALCGENPRVLYASINILSVDRLRSSAYSGPTTPPEYNVVDHIKSHSVSGLYRLEGTGTRAGKPVDVDAVESWDGAEKKFVFRHVAGVGAAYGKPGTTAAERNYLQAWRNISSITGTRAGHLVVTTSAVKPVGKGQDIPYSVDGGVFICHNANQPADLNAAQMEPSFELMFTHPAAAAAAFRDRLGGERLFVALNTYGRLEEPTAADPRSITPLTNSLDDGTQTLAEGDGAYRNSSYFNLASEPQVPTWPQGIFEVGGWKSYATPEGSDLDLDKPPTFEGGCGSALSAPKNGNLTLFGINDNVCALSQQWIRLVIDRGRLMAGAFGSGGFWRKLPPEPAESL